MTPDPALRHTRDLVVIGCSAGGVEALPRILQQLPSDLEASILIVQHMAANNPSYLAGILERTSRLPVGWAEQGARLERGRVLVGPPDVHLMVQEGYAQLSGGPRENYARPSINKLFRSAAASYGSRTIGVLLTGMMEDGVAGLRAIREAGGAVIVQDPASAAFPELPSRALGVITPDRVLPIDGIGRAITDLVGEQVGAAAMPADLALEAELDREGPTSPVKLAALGPQTPLSCPECHGPLWEVGDEDLRRFRCYLGHATTAPDMLAASSVEVEAALWSAVRALNDRATTLETLAADARRVGNGQSSASYQVRGRETRRHAELLRKFMLDLSRK